MKAEIWASNALIAKARAVKPGFKRGWKTFGGKRIYFRSGWEMKYALYLEWQKSHGVIQSWEHEPKTFWFQGIKRGCVTYLPDFKVTNLDGTHEWIEVKGYMDSKSKTKIKRFGKYFPEEKLTVVDGSWFKAKNSKFIPTWGKA